MLRHINILAWQHFLNASVRAIMLLSEILELKGSGTYAEVVRCRDLSTNKNVAIKISRYYSNAKHEASLLRQLSGLSHKKNVVKFIKSFKYRDHYCIVLEHLDKSLYDLMRERKKKPLHILDIRHITEQLLVTFEELAKRRLVHADLKINNIMLVKHRTEPFRVKLIDFGVTTTVSALTAGLKLQAVAYRAPEVSLGLELNEAIDMWALGCVLSYLYQDSSAPLPGQVVHRNKEMTIPLQAAPTYPAQLKEVQKTRRAVSQMLQLMIAWTHQMLPEN
uniref:Protein kinase domain-containing protein n=1 Tax=Neogobius melanostomus TaxID=47308 RepID=A0A8C6UU61_9GOBI